MPEAVQSDGRDQGKLAKPGDDSISPHSGPIQKKLTVIEHILDVSASAHLRSRAEDLSHPFHAMFLREQAEVTIEHALREADRILRRDISSAGARQAAEGAEKAALDFLYQHLDRQIDFFAHATDHSIVSVFGTARDNAVKQVTKDFLDILANRAVGMGISLANGGADTGAMGRSSDSWRNEISSNPDSESKSKLFLATLGIRSTREEPYPWKDLPFIHVSSPFPSFLSRTPSLYALGNQNAHIYLEGGIGTIEELFRGLHERNHNGKGAFDSFHPEGAFSQMYLISEGGFYDGMKAFMNTMVGCGAANSDEFSGLHFISLDGSQKRAGKISGAILNGFSAEDLSLEGSNRATPAEEEFLKQMVEALDSDEEFNTRLFETGTPHFIRALDIHYKEQVSREAMGAALEAFRQGELAEMAVAEGLTLAREYRPQLKHFVKICEGDDTITIVGSERDEVWNKELDLAADHLVTLAVENNISLVIGGDRRHGIAFQISKRWAEQKQLNPESSSKLIRVQMGSDRVGKLHVDMANGTSAQDKFLQTTGFYEVLGPPMQTLMASTPLRLHLGNPLGVVAFPFGLEGAEVVAGAALAAQLHKLTETPYSSGDNKDFTPPIFYIDPVLPGNDKPFFSGWKQQLNSCVAGGTIDSKDLVDHTFLPANDTSILGSLNRLRDEILAARGLKQEGY